MNTGPRKSLYVVMVGLTCSYIHVGMFYLMKLYQVQIDKKHFRIWFKYVIKMVITTHQAAIGFPMDYFTSDLILLSSFSKWGIEA